MERLDAADVSALLAFVSELRDVDDPIAFPPSVLSALGRLIPANAIAYSELNPANETSILQIFCVDGEETLVWGVRDEDRRIGEHWWRVRPTHPVCGYRGRSGNWTEPLKVSDFATLREFRRTQIYDAFYSGELDYWLDVGLPATPTKTRVFIFARKGGRDFDDRDKLTLELLRPHLEARAAATANAAAAAASLAASEESASNEAHRVVLCSASGTVEFASRASRALLDRYVPMEKGHLPASLLSHTAVVLARGSGRLTIRVAKSGHLRVLLLDECDARVERLTPRERAILDRVARGQANAEIALELGIATATVAKHLEHVYNKLGVASRTAAAALVAA